MRTILAQDVQEGQVIVLGSGNRLVEEVSTSSGGMIIIRHSNETASEVYEPTDRVLVIE